MYNFEANIVKPLANLSFKHFGLFHLIAYELQRTNYFVIGLCLTYYCTLYLGLQIYFLKHSLIAYKYHLVCNSLSIWNPLRPYSGYLQLQTLQYRCVGIEF